MEYSHIFETPLELYIEHLLEKRDQAWTDGLGAVRLMFANMLATGRGTLLALETQRETLSKTKEHEDPWMVSLYEFVLEERKRTHERTEMVEKEILVQLEKQIKYAAVSAQKRRTALEQIRKTVANRQKKLVAVISSYERELGEHTKDLWLTEQALRVAASYFLAEKEIYYELLKKEVDSLCFEEKDKTEWIRETLVAFFENEARVSPSPFLEKLCPKIEGISPKEELERVKRQYKLAHEWSLGIPPLSGFMCSIRSHVLSRSNTGCEFAFQEIKKTLLLKRQKTRLIGKFKWKPSFGVITQTHLHLYNVSGEIASDMPVLNSGLPDRHETERTKTELYKKLFFPDDPTPSVEDSLFLSVAVLQPLFSIALQECTLKKLSDNSFLLENPPVKTLFGTKHEKFYFQAVGKDDIEAVCDLFAEQPSPAEAQKDGEETQTDAEAF
ncbi:MAG: uncharacterized protein A8A55_1721 [Amphiamblys sp. WSBS2006]|nr:MAG: uncharacterized protein A8A55_1721 [Amphiamblys sp. WSBS2006]